MGLPELWCKRWIRIHWRHREQTIYSVVPYISWPWKARLCRSGCEIWKLRHSAHLHISPVSNIQKFQVQATLPIRMDIGMDWNGNKFACNDIQQCRLWVCILDLNFIYQGHLENDAKINLSPWVFLHKTFACTELISWCRYMNRAWEKKLSYMNKWHWTAFCSVAYCWVDQECMLTFEELFLLGNLRNGSLYSGFYSKFLWMMSVLIL